MSTEIVEWGDVDRGQANSSSTGGDRKPVYLKLEAGRSYVVRPIYKPMQVYKFFNNLPDGQFRHVIVDDPETCPISEKYPEMKPSLRYAINIIDRSDAQIKILEGPPSIFRGFKKWFEKTKKAPGGNDGGDFGIDVEIPAGKTKLQTKYDCQFIESKPFTKEEIRMIKEDPKAFPLPDIYKPTSPDDMEKILFDKDAFKPREQQTSERSVSPSDDDDDTLSFSDDDADAETTETTETTIGDDDTPW